MTTSKPSSDDDGGATGSGNAPESQLTPQAFYMLFHCLAEQQDPIDASNQPGAGENVAKRTAPEDSLAAIDDRGKGAYNAYMAFNHLLQSVSYSEFVMNVLVPNDVHKSPIAAFLQNFGGMTHLQQLASLRRIYEDIPVVLMRLFVESLRFWMPTGVLSLQQDCLYGIHSVLTFYTEVAELEQSSSRLELSPVCAELFMNLVGLLNVPEQRLEELSDPDLDGMQRLFRELFSVLSALAGFALQQPENCLQSLSTICLAVGKSLDERPLFSQHLLSQLDIDYVGDAIINVMLWCNEPRLKVVDVAFIRSVVLPFVSSSLRQLNDADSLVHFAREDKDSTEHGTTSMGTLYVDGVRFVVTDETLKIGSEDEKDSSNNEALLRSVLFYSRVLRTALPGIRRVLSDEEYSSLLSPITNEICESWLRCRISRDLRYVGMTIALQRFQSDPLVTLVRSLPVISECENLHCDLHVMCAIADAVRNTEAPTAVMMELFESYVVSALQSGVSSDRDAFPQFFSFLGQHASPRTRTEKELRESMCCILDAVADLIQGPWRGDPTHMWSLITPIVTLSAHGGGQVCARAVATLADIVKFGGDEAIAANGESALQAFMFVLETRCHAVFPVVKDTLSRAGDPSSKHLLQREWLTLGTVIYGAGLVIGKIPEGIVTIEQLEFLHDICAKYTAADNDLQAVVLAFDNAAGFNAVATTHRFSAAIEYAMHAMTRLRMFYRETMSRRLNDEIHDTLYSQLPLVKDVSIIGAVANERALDMIARWGFSKKKALREKEMSFVKRCAGLIDTPLATPGFINAFNHIQGQLS